MSFSGENLFLRKHFSFYIIIILFGSNDIITGPASLTHLPNNHHPSIMKQAKDHELSLKSNGCWCSTCMLIFVRLHITIILSTIFKLSYNSVDSSNISCWIWVEINCNKITQWTSFWCWSVARTHVSPVNRRSRVLSSMPVILLFSSFFLFLKLCVS